MENEKLFTSVSSLLSRHHALGLIQEHETTIYFLHYNTAQE
jgi:hypothetical protein